MSTGRPLTFRCSRCRLSRNRSIDEVCRAESGKKGWINHVTLTGRTRPHVCRSGPRSDDVEYTCQDCGHTGWSSHLMIVMRLRRERIEKLEAELAARKPPSKEDLKAALEGHLADICERLNKGEGIWPPNKGAGHG